MIKLFYCEKEVPYKKFYFPSGELQVKLEGIENYDCDLSYSFDIEWHWEGKNEELVELLFLTNAIVNAKLQIGYITIPYLPYSRQDKISSKGECFSLEVITSLLKNIQSKGIIVYDKHSNILLGYYSNVPLCNLIAKYESIYKHKIPLESSFYVVPDKGAGDRVYKIDSMYPSMHRLIHFDKKRNPETGEIESIELCDPNIFKNLNGSQCTIFDDICGNGGTFIEIAKQLKAINAGKVILVVTHFFGKDLTVFENIDEIYCITKGKIK